jgi:hypothetical protein
MGDSWWWFLIVSGFQRFYTGSGEMPTLICDRSKDVCANITCMSALFWVSTLVLLCLSGAFFLPWIKPRVFGLAITSFFAFSAYGLYWHWGSSQYFDQYYSAKEQQFRARQPGLRALLTEFKKEEYRLKLSLEENPKDKDASARLVELLAIKALIEGKQPSHAISD